MFPDESLLSLEYLFEGDGLVRREFEDHVRAVALFSQAQRLGLDVLVAPGADGAGLPQKFAFAPLVRHYAFLSYQKPKIRDDFTLGAVVIANLQDLSGMFSPSVSWSTTEWLTLSLNGFIPYPGPPSLATYVPELDARVSEYTLIPMEYRVVFAARAFY
jgi:hypothetical protein